MLTKVSLFCYLTLVKACLKASQVGQNHLSSIDLLVRVDADHSKCWPQGIANHLGSVGKTAGTTMLGRSYYTGECYK